jgi:hypothetical protein
VKPQLYGCELLYLKFEKFESNMRRFFRFVCSLPSCFPSSVLSFFFDYKSVQTTVLHRRVGFVGRVLSSMAQYVRAAVRNHLFLPWEGRNNFFATFVADCAGLGLEVQVENSDFDWEKLKGDVDRIRRVVEFVEGIRDAEELKTLPHLRAWGCPLVVFAPLRTRVGFSFSNAGRVTLIF